jgi:uncharacterized repeat protein (TIGR01451 family)
VGTAVPAGTWRVGALVLGGTATMTMNVNVTVGTVMTNTAQINYSDQYDPDSVPNNSVATEDDQATVTVTPSPDLQITKVATGSFAVGTNGTYGLTVNNIGRVASSGTYTVVDVLPTGLTYVSATGTGWTCANASGTVTCTSSTVIAAGGTNANAITLTVLPAVAAAPQVTNSASVAGGGEPATNNGNNSSTITTPVCNSNCPDLKVLKTFSVASIAVGTTATYTLSVTNVGGLTTGANAYVLNDPLPTGMTLYSVPVAGAGWTCAAAAPVNTVNGTSVNCTRSTAILPGGTSTAVTFAVNVSAAAVPEAENIASVSGGGEPSATQTNNSTTLTTPVTDFDLAVSKTVTAGSFTVGTNSTYIFTVTNSGSRATSGTYTFTDTLPAGLTIRSNSPTNWTLGTGWTCAIAGTTNAAGGSLISCKRATAIAVNGSSTTVTVPVTVAAAAAPSVSNTVDVSGVYEASALTGNNSFTLVTPVLAPDLAITKSHNGTFAVGTTETYTITVTNIGRVATSAAYTVVDTLPAGLTYLNNTGSGANWGTCSAAGQVITCTNSTAIAISDSAQPLVINVMPTATAANASPVVNTATVSGGGEPAGNNGNNSTSDSAVVSYPPVIAKTFTPTSIVAGGTATLTLTITNANPAGSGITLQGLLLNDPFPNGMAVAANPTFSNTCGGTVSSGSAQGDTQVALSGGSTAGPGTSCVVKVVVTASGVGALVNTTAAISSTNAGIGNTASATLTTTAPGNAILTKRTSPNPIGIGETAQLTFTITNKATATNDIRFNDALPPGVYIPTGAVFSGTCVSTTGTALGRTSSVTNGTTTIAITGVDLAATTTSCTISVPVTSNTAGSYVNDSSRISNLANVTATTLSDTLVVEAATLTKTFSPSSILVGGTATMSLVLNNSTAKPEHNGMGFTESLPTGLVLASVPAASQCSGTVSGTAGGTTVTVANAVLADGLASCTITAIVTSAAAGTYNNLAANITTITSNLVKNVNATLTVTVAVPTLEKTNNQTTITPGSSTTYSIIVGNDNPVTFTGTSAVVLKDPVVANLSITSASCAAQGGATCPTGTSAAMITALQGSGGLSITSLPQGGTVTFTLNAQLTGNPSGLLTNVVTATTNGSTVTASDSDTVIYPAMLNTKTVTVLNDPVNGTTNPKAIPGAEVMYTIQITNQGTGAVDANSLYLTDTIPANTELFVGDLGGSGSGPILFTATTSPPAGLTWTYNGGTTDDIDFLNVPMPTLPAVPNWTTFTPTANAQGYDSTVQVIRLNPKGTLPGAASAPYPGFTVQFKVRIK